MNTALISLEIAVLLLALGVLLLDLWLPAENKRKLGYVAPGVDTRDGDVWEVGGETYVVEGMEAITDCRVCALSVYRRGA